jgi:cellulose synthase/poly-beta-1,6-N-acetylglucosamine synthase-like glycosyltransferase
MFRRSVWAEVAGFPEVLSEDIAFATEARLRGYEGVFAEQVIAEESPPATYAALSRKYQKIIRGTVEFFQKYWRRILLSRNMSLIEKMDIAMTFTYCYIGAVTMYNTVGAIIL